MSSESGTWLCARVGVVQDGARLHYAIPIALRRAGVLERVWTDFYVKRRSIWGVVAAAMGVVRPQAARRMLGRRSDELDDRQIMHRPFTTWQLRRLRHLPLDRYVEETCEVMGRWMMRGGIGACNAVFGFIRDFDPTFFEFCRAKGCVTVGDQMSAPIAEAVRVARDLHARWPGWGDPAEIERMLRLERFQVRSWNTLDHFTCPSLYVESGLRASGIDQARITVLRYPISLDDVAAVDRSTRSQAMTVGYVGRISLAKGAPFWLEVARRLESSRIRFVMVGAIGAPASIVDAKRGRVELVGPVPRTEVAAWLSKFDVFLFPATCEGSAGSVIEAMASGLPVVTTPNSGTFARHGQEGFLHDYDDIEGMAASIERLCDDAGLRARMGAAARDRVREYAIDSYARDAAAMFEHLVNARR